MLQNTLRYCANDEMYSCLIQKTLQKSILTLFLIVLFRLTTGHTAGRSGQNTDIKKWFSKGKVMSKVEHGETLLL